MTWDMYAYLEDDGRLTTVGGQRYVEAHMFRQPIVPVLAEEVADTEEPTHWGWMGFAYSYYEADTEPNMIWPRYFQLEMCFPYGIKDEVDAGKGRVVPLRVTRRYLTATPTVPESDETCADCGISLSGINMHMCAPQ